MPNPQLTELISDTTRAFEHQSSGVLRHPQWHTELAEQLQAILTAEGYSVVRAAQEKPAGVPKELNGPITECIQQFINGWAMGDPELSPIVNAHYFAEGLGDLIADQLPDLIRTTEEEK